MSTPRWTAPPGWPQPPEGWSPPAGWTPDLTWPPAPEGWDWWQVPAAHPPFWKARTVAQTSPRFTRSMAAVAGVIAVLLVAGSFGDSTGDASTVGARDVAESAAPQVPTSGPSPARPIPPPPVSAAAPDAPAPPTTEDSIAQADPDTALALLGPLAVKGRAPKTGYAREQFGQRWADTDRNGCDTRNDVLKRDLTDATFKSGTRDCVVLTGTLAEPFTGRTLSFTKADADAVQIDHVVSLSDAWQKGGQQWAADKRLAFANDPLNLLAVDGPANSSKSDGDAATWLPPNTSYRCPLVARQIAVKAKYGLWMTAAERDASARVLTGCPRERTPSSDHPTVAPVAPPQPAAPAPAAPPPAEPAPAAPPPAAGPAPAKEYANCTELRKDYRGGVARPGAVNKGGATRNQPHYDDALYEANTKSDRDKDGIACEN